MPDKHGFDHLPDRGNVELRCIWCGQKERPGVSEGRLAQHARKHRKDAAEAAEASKREVTTAQTAIVV